MRTGDRKRGQVKALESQEVFPKCPPLSTNAYRSTENRWPAGRSGTVVRLFQPVNNATPASHLVNGRIEIIDFLDAARRGLVTTS